MPWTPVDYQVQRLNSPFTQTSPASATLALAAPGGSQLFRVERISAKVIYDQTVGAPVIGVSVFDQTPGTGIIEADQTELVPSPFLSQFPAAVAAALDIADEGSPITVQAGNQLTIVFTVATSVGLFGMVAGAAIAYARIQYAVFQGVAGQAQPVAGAQAPPAVPVSI